MQAQAVRPVGHICAASTLWLVLAPNALGPPGTICGILPVQRSVIEPLLVS